jgi:hypothetical protein
MSLKDIIESEAKAVEDAEGAEPLRDLSEVTVTRGNGRGRVLQVRLNDEEFEAVQAAAGDLPASTFARAVLLRSIQSESVWTARLTAPPLPDIQAPRSGSVDFPELILLLSKTVAPLEARLEALERHSA